MKLRTDFVSNSSSSSYIIDLGKVTEPEAADIVAKNIGDGEDEIGNNWLCPLFEDNVVLACAEIFYRFPDWEFDNYIPDGLSVAKEELDKYFGADGNVRAELDKRKVIESLSWNTHKGRENEYVVYNARPYGAKITEKSVKFTEWLLAACKEVCGEENVHLGWDSEDADSQTKNFEEIKVSLAEGNSVFYIQTCSGGDPDCGLYVADSRKDNNGWKRFRKECKKMLHSSYG